MTEKADALRAYSMVLKQARELEAEVFKKRKELLDLHKKYERSEDDLKALQSVGQIIGEVLRQLTEDKCALNDDMASSNAFNASDGHMNNDTAAAMLISLAVIVKASSGPRYVVGCRTKIDKSQLTAGRRVTLDVTTLTIMRILPREVDPMVFNMLNEDPGNTTYQDVGGLSEQLRELREATELPLTNPELFLRVGVKPPKGVLLYGPPGTGKTLMARALASNMDASFLKVVSSALVDKYIGESARLIREMFGYARDHEPCLIFMDEIDAIGGRRFSEGTSADREIQRTLMELLNQMDGFDVLGRVKIIMATNRPDTLDPALLRPGRLDRKIEIGLPNEESRVDILKIHSEKLKHTDDVDLEAVAKLADGFNGADLRNVCTEAGMLAIRELKNIVTHDHFMNAVRKIAETKKLEQKLDYSKV